MNETFKTVGLFEATRSVDKDYDKDIDALCSFLMEPFSDNLNTYLNVTVPTMVRYQFEVRHVIKALSCMVKEEMMTEESAKALETALGESGATEVEVENFYCIRVKVEGCNW